MKIEPVTINDIEKIRDLQPDDWNDIVPDIQFYIDSPFCHPVKATIDNTIVGTGALISFGKSSWIGHIIVDAQYRNNGIGLQVVNNLLDIAKKNSIDTCSLIATELGKPVYLKTGFRTVTEYLFLKREEPWRECSVSGNVVSFTENYRAAIQELDLAVSGEDRRILLDQFIQNSKLYLQNNNVAGYYIPDLKEGTIVANTTEAGLELMKLKYAKADKAVLPIDNIEGIAFLKQQGFTETGKGTRMVFGNDLNWQPLKIYSRVSGNFG
jgi:N-acetylglutamate synthase-like GNAT family acetyltransferase